MFKKIINFIYKKNIKIQKDKNLYEHYTEEAFDKETDKKCPCCDGTLDFDPEIQGLICPYCGYKKEIEFNNTKAEELDFNKAEHIENCNWGIETKTVVCKFCGAEIIYDNLDISGTCPYCGSNQVMNVSYINTIAPGGICKFKITEKEALNNFQLWMKRKFFCPSEVKKNIKPGKIKGIYLPYWTFDIDTSSNYTGEYGIDKHYTDNEGNDKIDTDWYKTSGIYKEFINDELIIATTKHDNSILKGLAPFNTEDNVSYKPEYISGFGAERYSIDLNDAFKKAKEYIKSHLMDKVTEKIKNDNNADRSVIVNIETTFSNIKYKYLLLPIWVSSFKYKGKSYKFMINGQTGKVSGRTPISFIRALLVVILAILIIALIIYVKKS